GQAALAAEGVVDGPEESGPRGEDGDDELGQGHGERIEVPGGMAEEAMEAAPMADADLAAGEDDLGDVAVSVGEDPAGDDPGEGPEGRGGEGRGEDLSQGNEPGSKFHESASVARGRMSGIINHAQRTWY